MKSIGWLFVFLGLTAPLPAFLYFMPSFACCPQQPSNERNARATLKTFTSAQSYFRERDFDGDGQSGYWREDVAGLYNLWSSAWDDRIKLIEFSAACADLAPRWAVLDGVEGPKAGYEFAALRFEDETGEPDPDRFVICALPVSTSAGKWVYAITHDGTVWQRPARWARDLPSCFPLAPLSEGWRASD